MSLSKLAKKVLKGVALAALVVGPAQGLFADAKVDPAIPAYQKVSGISGSLDSIGSDTLNNLMTYWAESFRAIYPNVRIQIEGKGSSTAPPALIEGTSQLGPMSRPMKSKEIDAFETKYGFKPTNFGVALDSLAVYVSKDNPIKELSLTQLDGIFSQTRKSGSEEITKWSQVGLTDKLGAMPISLYGRNSASGTYGYFKEHALAKGDYKDSVKEQPGSASVVMGVAEDISGIGYSGIGYKTSDVRAIPLSKKKGEPAYEPSYDNVLEGKYPLGRMLYIYIAKKPGGELSPVIREFLKFVYSKEGQEIVVKDGYLPLPKMIVDKQLANLK